MEEIPVAQLASHPRERPVQAVFQLRKGPADSSFISLRVTDTWLGCLPPPALQNYPPASPTTDDACLKTPTELSVWNWHVGLQDVHSACGPGPQVCVMYTCQTEEGPEVSGEGTFLPGVSDSHI